jgi:hypothetical protein
MPLAFLTEGTGEEMKGGLLPVSWAQDTVVVVSLEFVFLSSNHVSNIKSIHQEKPCEDSDFVGTLGFVLMLLGHNS